MSRGGCQGVLTPLFLDPPFSSVTPSPCHPTRSHSRPTILIHEFKKNVMSMFLNCIICSLGRHFNDINIPLASKYARFVVLARQMYWTPQIRTLDPPFLKSDDLFFREPRDIGPPLSKILDTPLVNVSYKCVFNELLCIQFYCSTISRYVF